VCEWLTAVCGGDVDELRAGGSEAGAGQGRVERVAGRVGAGRGGRVVVHAVARAVRVAARQAVGERAPTTHRGQHRRAHTVPRPHLHRRVRLAFADTQLHHR